MGRVTKIRASQTRAGEAYTKQDNSLATDREVEERVKKHSTLFHHNRNDNTIFSFDADGNLTSIEIKDPDTNDTLQKTDLSFDTDGNLSIIEKTIYDSADTVYTKLKKTLDFDADGNLSSISNELE